MFSNEISLNLWKFYINEHKLPFPFDDYNSPSQEIIKISLNIYFHTSLWCLKRFYEGLYVLHKTF